MNRQTSTGEASDAVLVEAIRAGDRAAESELYRRWHRRVYGCVRRILRDKPDLAEDATQEALWRAFCNLHRYDNSKPFKPWMLQIAQHLALDFLRRLQTTRVRLPTRGDDGGLENVAGPSRPASNHSASQEEIEALDACKEGLSELDRTVVTFFALGFSLSQTGEILRAPKTTVQSRLQKALDQLRKCMAERGLT